MKLTPIKYSLHKAGEAPQFNGIHLTITDEAGGEFLIIDDTSNEGGEIRLDFRELEAIYDAMQQLGKLN